MAKAPKIKEILRKEAISHLDKMQEEVEKGDLEAAKLHQELAKKSMNKI